MAELMSVNPNQNIFSKMRNLFFNLWGLGRLQQRILNMEDIAVFYLYMLLFLVVFYLYMVLFLVGNALLENHLI